MPVFDQSHARTPQLVQRERESPTMSPRPDQVEAPQPCDNQMLDAMSTTSLCQPSRQSRERQKPILCTHTPDARKPAESAPFAASAKPKMSVRRHGAIHPVMPGMVMNRNCVTPYHERPNCVISPFLDVEKYSRLRLHRLRRASNAAFIWSRTPARG